MYSYHNTTRATGFTLDDYEDKAKSQEMRILAWFRNYDQTASPSYLCRNLFQNEVPITSVRRALTNLTTKQDLIKTDKQVKGLYGRLEHQWALPSEQLRLDLVPRRQVEQ